MEDSRVGWQIRLVRQRRGLTQAELAARCGVAQSTISRLENGDLDGASLRLMRSVSRALRMPPVVNAGWRGADVARLADKDHAALVEETCRRLRGLRWTALPEWSFSHYGERGCVDILATREQLRAVLIIEVKSRIVDLQDMLGSMDRKRRLVPDLYRREAGWRATCVGVVLVLADRSTHRHTIERHEETFAAALPARQVEVRHWLTAPSGPLAGIWFLPFIDQVDNRKGRDGRSGPSHGDRASIRGGNR